LCTSVAPARTWKVVSDGEVGKTCDATNPQQLLQKAKLQRGDEVRIYPGTYDGGLRLPGGTEWIAVNGQGQPARPAPGKKNPVVIDAAGKVQGFRMTGGGNTVEGFEIRGAAGEGWGAGAGIWILNNGRATIEHCLFTGNARYGLFISNRAHGVTVRQCTFVENSIVEAGNQGVHDNHYESNTLFDAGIRIPAGNPGATGEGNRCLTGPFDSPRPNPVYQPKLTADHFPTYGKLLLTVDGRKMVIGRRLRSCDVTITGPDGQKIAARSMEEFTGVVPRGSVAAEERTEYTALARRSLTVGDLREGTYNVTARLEGREVPDTLSATFRRVKLPWEDSELGVSDRVLPPWTPLKYDPERGEMTMWGRRYTFAPSGLFQQLRTAGKDVLTRPVRLEAATVDGEVEFQSISELTLPERTKSAITTKGKLSGQFGDAQLDVSIEATTEYDGFTKFRLELNPRQPVKLRSLRLLLPMSDRFATHLHAAGAAMRRSVWAGRLPQEQGVVWDSTMSRGKIPDAARMTVGSFKPYIWIGRAGVGGLAYMADNDRGWIPNDGVPAFQVIRTEKQTTRFVFNFISEPAVLQSPRTIVFSLQATPVKPLPDDFRAVAGQVDNLCSFVGGQGSYHAGSRYHLTGWDGGYLPDGRKANSPFPVDWWKNKWYNRRLADQGRIYLPYQTINYTHLADPIHPKLKGPTGQEFWNLQKAEIRCDGHGGWCKVPAHINYRLFRYRRWIKENRIRGFYFDNAYPILCRKLETGCGYRLPDGRIQPGYNLFGLREFFKRLRTMIIDERLDPCIFCHSTDTFMAPAYSFIDMMMDGENRFIRPDNERYFSEIWPLDHFQTMETPQHWGITTIFIPEFHGDWSEKRDWRKAQNRSYRGYLMLHDVEGHYMKHRWAGKLDLEKEIRFLPYWLPSVNQHLNSPAEDVLVSGYNQNNKLVLVAFNHSRQERPEAGIRVHPTGLGFGDVEGLKKSDSGKGHIPVGEDGWAGLKVDLKPHDYALVVLEVE
jgi:hypothetical protein